MFGIKTLILSSTGCWESDEIENQRPGGEYRDGVIEGAAERVPPPLVEDGSGRPFSPAGRHQAMDGGVERRGCDNFEYTSSHGQCISRFA